MIDSAELQSRILAVLEEAHEDTITATLNTIIRPSGDLVETRDYLEGVKQLIEQGLVRVAISRGADRRLLGESATKSLGLASDFVQSFFFDRSRNIWTMPFVRDTLPDRKPYPNLVLTPEGASQAEAIIRSRGERWWCGAK